MQQAERVSDKYVERLVPFIQRAGHFSVSLYAGKDLLPWDEPALRTPAVVAAFKRYLPTIVRAAQECRLYRNFGDSLDALHRDRVKRTGRTLRVDLADHDVASDTQFWWSVVRSGYTASFLFNEHAFPSEELFDQAKDPTFIDNPGVTVGRSALRFARSVTDDGQKIAALLSGTAYTVDVTVVAEPSTAVRLFLEAASVCGVVYGAR